MKNIKHKPLSHKERERVFNSHALINIFLLTGVRLAEAKRIIDEYDVMKKDDYIDIKTKKSHGSNRIFLSKKVRDYIQICQYLKGKSIKTYQRVVENVSDKLNIPFSSHNLRATFATNLLENGVDLVSVSTLMNHGDLSITAKYIKLNESFLRAGLQTLEDDRTIEGMTSAEMRQEIVRLRARLIRKEYYSKHGK